MPNDGQVQILKRGVSIWNEWRKGHLDVIPDLSYADLRGLDAGRYNEDYYHEMDDLRNEIERGEGTPVNIFEITEEEIGVDDLFPQFGFGLRHAKLSNAMLDGACLTGSLASGGLR